MYSKEKLEKPSKPDYWLKGGQKYEGESGPFLYGKAKVGQFHSLPHAARNELMIICSIIMQNKSIVGNIQSLF